MYLLIYLVDFYQKQTSMKFQIIILILFFILTETILASDTLVWQGQYYTGTTFNVGTFVFNFTVYNALTDGTPCYSNSATLTTGNFGEWYTEQSGVSQACNDSLKDYFLNINIDRKDQLPRKRLTSFSFLRKDVDEMTSGIININGSNSSTLELFHNPEGHYFSISTTRSSPFTEEHAVVMKNYECGPTVFVNQGFNSFMWRIMNNNIMYELMTLTSSAELIINGTLSAKEIDASRNINSSNYTLNGTTINDWDDVTQKATPTNLSNYALKNQSETFTGNLTISDQIVTDSGCRIPHATFWGERAGAVTAGGNTNGLQYSFGDGNIDGGPVQPCSGKVVYLTVHAQNANNGDGRIDISVNGGLNSTCFVATPASDGGKTQANCTLIFNQGDHLEPRTTITPSGTNNGYIVLWSAIYD